MEKKWFQSGFFSFLRTARTAKKIPLEVQLTYLAIPYSFNPEDSFRIANEVAADLMEMGHVVFSPISHSHPIAQYLPEECLLDYQFWMDQDLPILGKCDKMVLVCLGDNGEELISNSRGCQREIKFARENNIEIITYYYAYVS